MTTETLQSNPQTLDVSGAASSAHAPAADEMAAKRAAGRPPELLPDYVHDPGGVLTLRVGCEFVYVSQGYTPTIMQVEARRDTYARIIEEQWETSPHVASHSYFDSYGNRCRRLTLPPGETVMRYDALVEVSSYPDPQVPDATQALVQDLPDETLVYTLASRYCLSDVLSDAAWELFADSPPGWGRVQAISDWANENIIYVSGCSTPDTTALDVYNARQGICRDFAHIGVTLCRALNIPARYCFGYMPDIGVVVPDVAMDFHAWFEAYLGGEWRTFDARHNVPRIGRVPIAEVAMLSIALWSPLTAPPPAPHDSVGR
jgi:transglutaminase-like putative cysteine protease